MFWIALAAQLSAPWPVDYLHWWHPEDMPFDVQRGGVTRAVLARTTVRPDGTIQGCEVERGSGNSNLDAVTCQIFLKRGKFEPARASDGEPVFGVYRQIVTWAMNPEDKSPFPGDVELQLWQVEYPRRTYRPICRRVGLSSQAVQRDRAGRSRRGTDRRQAAAPGLNKACEEVEPGWLPSQSIWTTPHWRFAGTATSIFFGRGSPSEFMMLTNSSTVLPPPRRALRCRSCSTQLT